MSDVELNFWESPRDGPCVEVALSAVGPDGCSEELMGWVPWNEWQATVKRIEEAYRCER